MVQDPGPGSLRGIQAGQQSAAAAGAAAPSGGNPRMLGRIQSFALARAQPQSTGSHSSSSQASQATAPPPPPPPVVAGRVLAAEDDRASQLILKKTLERMGFDPLVVGDGQQALDAWRDDPGGWDLIIVDYNMPLLTGALLCTTSGACGTVSAPSAGLQDCAVDSVDLHLQFVTPCLTSILKSHFPDGQARRPPGQSRKFAQGKACGSLP